MSEGLRAEDAASAMLRDTITQHFAAFQLVIRGNRTTGKAVTAAYVDGLAGAVALLVASGQHGSQEQVTENAILALRAAIKRDLSHLKRI